MTKFILFFNSFLSYLLIFVLITVLVIIACILGNKWRKISEAKKAGMSAEGAAGNGADTD